MVQSRRCPGFLSETLHAVGIASNIVGQNLQGDLAIEPRVLRQIDFTHPSGAQGAPDLIPAEHGAGCEHLAEYAHSGVFRQTETHTTGRVACGGRICAGIPTL